VQHTRCRAATLRAQAQEGRALWGDAAHAAACLHLGIHSRVDQLELRGRTHTGTTDSFELCSQLQEQERAWPAEAAGVSAKAYACVPAAPIAARSLLPGWGWGGSTATPVRL
jgi:hypothetical protein